MLWGSRARESWPTIWPLIIESDEEHPSYSQECRWVFFSRYSASISRSRRSLRSTILPSLSSARQRKLIWPHESPVQPCPPPFPYILLPLFPVLAAAVPGLGFDLSRRCRQPLINIQEQPFCYVHRSSWWSAGDSSESRWLFLNVLERTSGRNVSKILRSLAMISREALILEDCSRSAIYCPG